MRLPGLFKQLSYPRAVIRSPALVLPGATKKQGAGSGGGPSAATQTDQEAASSTAVYTSPGTQHFHPGHPKAWVDWGVTTTINADYGVASITDHAAGDWTVTYDTAFSTANYAAHHDVEASGAGTLWSGWIKDTGQAAGSCRVVAGNQSSDQTGVPADPTSNFFVALGDL